MTAKKAERSSKNKTVATEQPATQKFSLPGLKNFPVK
jgi:hypothetical protein